MGTEEQQRLECALEQKVYPHRDTSQMKPESYVKKPNYVYSSCCNGVVESNCWYCCVHNKGVCTSGSCRL